MSVIIVTSILAKLGDVSGSVGRSHRSEEVSVMGMEQRASVIWSYYFKQPLKSNGMMKEEKTKSFAVSKRMVYNSYLKVMSKNGCAGIDGESIKMFEADMSKNLYKIYNRMASGSYFPPPVRTALIPKKQGGFRPLGIPTVGDRIAQGVVKDHLEPSMDKMFHDSSFGYRPGRSAHDALAQCHANCLQYAWVVDVDIKGFFDNISHDKLMELLRQHTEEKWVLLYVDRWLRAGIEQEDGSILARTKGTPQGGVISPLLSNLYLDHAFDNWMKQSNPDNPFERYADDIVIHCRSKEEAIQLLAALEIQMDGYSLTLHPEKTKIVYCKNYLRNEEHDQNSFTFLSYTFRPRAATDKFDRNKLIVLFNGAISKAAKTSIRQSVRKVLNPQWTNGTLDAFAKVLNPKIRGWINYYGKFFKSRMIRIFDYLDYLMQRWLANKYRITSKAETLAKLRRIKEETPGLFYHWKFGINNG
jgi:group II intron reverse transcriptase/maturase